MVSLRMIARFGLLWASLALPPAAVQAQFILATNNGTIAIVRYTGSDDAVTIPDTTNGLPITGIEEAAFFDCSSLTNVTIGTNVTIVGVEAFWHCTNLTSVMIGTSVTNIGTMAFYQCTRLAHVTIPDSVISISNGAFLACTSLCNAMIGSGLASIGIGAFAICPSLTNIAMSASNLAYSSVGGVLFDKSQTTLVEYPGGIPKGSYAIPDGTTSIGSRAFISCGNLTSVTIGNGVTNIGDDAFAGCGHLASVMIGSGVTSIGQETFEDCTNLTRITIGNRVTNIHAGAFFDCRSLTSVTIPDSVTTIEEATFGWCTSLTAVYSVGNAPNGGSGSSVFYNNAANATVYYRPGTTNWGSTFGGLPAVPWNPHVRGDANFGIGTNGFGFAFTNAGNPMVVVEACTNLASPAWVPLATNALVGGSSQFGDPQWTNYPYRFYRFGMPW